MTAIRSWRWRAAAVAAVALGAAHTAVWLVAAQRVDAGVDGFLAEAAANGWQVQAGPRGWGGWPLAAGVVLPEVVATRPLGGTALRWSAERVDVRLLPTDWSGVLISAAGAQRVGLGSEGVGYRTDHSRLRAPLAGDGPAALDVAGLVAGDDRAGVRVGRLIGRVGLAAFGGTAEGVALSPALPAPFDRAFAVTAGVVLSTPFPEAATPRESAAAWRGAGGRATVPSVQVDWGPLHVDGSGSGGLDAGLQPVGRATLRVRGAVAVLDAAAQGGLVAPGPASAMRAVLGLLALAAPDGAVTLPISLEDRTLTVAQFPVARLPLLEWALP